MNDSMPASTSRSWLLTELLAQADVQTDDNIVAFGDVNITSISSDSRRVQPGGQPVANTLAYGLGRQQRSAIAVAPYGNAGWNGPAPVQLGWLGKGDRRGDVALLSGNIGEEDSTGRGTIE